MNRESGSHLLHHNYSHCKLNIFLHHPLNLSTLFLKIVLILTVLLTVIIGSSNAFRNSVANVTVPEKARIGDDVTLHCNHGIKSSTRLYKVRWLLNDQEFYRFERAGRPQSFYTPLSGANVQVNLLASDGEKVVLKNVSGLSSGLYRCEVTTEDSYEPLIGEGIMNVVTGWGSSSASSRTKFSSNSNTFWFVFNIRIFEKLITITSMIFYLWSIVTLLHVY